MPRLVVVLPLDPLTVGTSFAVADWPLHITVLPPFLTDAAPHDIATAIATAAHGRPTLTVRAGEDALFGRRHNIPVTLIEPHEELTRLHHALVAAIRPFAAVPDEPAFTGERFRAHVTMKPPARVHPGDTLTLGQIALVDMLPRADSAGRTVLAAHPFLPRAVT
jgi:2'-5' RNA ligase